MSQLIIFFIIPIFIISIIFASLVWMILSNKYKLNYKEKFSNWEREEIQKSLYEQKRRYDTYGEEENSGKLNLLIVKWESIAELNSLN